VLVAKLSVNGSLLSESYTMYSRKISLSVNSSSLSELHAIYLRKTLLLASVLSVISLSK
jgi:hypothetical protein